MKHEMKKRVGAIIGIIILVIVACFSGRRLVQALTPTVWTVTNFASTQDAQIMFYTIEDNFPKLHNYQKWN